MIKNDIAKLTDAIATRNCALFAGAGLTADGGGITWGNLIKHQSSVRVINGERDIHVSI